MNLLLLGDHERALEEMEIARELDPLSMIVGIDYASVAAAVGRYEQAEAEYLLLLERFPDVARVHYDYGAFLLGRGRFDEGMLHRLKGLEITGVQLSAEQRDSLLDRSTSAIAMSGIQVDRDLSSYILAAYAGDWERVMDILDTPTDPLEYDKWPGWLPLLGYRYPELAALPRYRVALERMGLPIPSR